MRRRCSWDQGYLVVLGLQDMEACRVAELLEAELPVPGTRCDWTPSCHARVAVCLPWAQSEFMKCCQPWGASRDWFCRAKAAFGALPMWVALTGFPYSLGFCLSRARKRREEEEEEAEACQEWGFPQSLSLGALSALVCAYGCPWVRGGLAGPEEWLQVPGRMKYYIVSERCESEWVNCGRGRELDKKVFLWIDRIRGNWRGLWGSEIHLGGRKKVINLWVRWKRLWVPVGIGMLGFGAKKVHQKMRWQSGGSCHFVLDSLHPGRDKGRVWVKGGALFQLLPGCYRGQR